jgi:hypothetical protein
MSNVERPILMALRFINLQASEPQNLEGLIRFAQNFIKLIEYIIRCWTFNVRCSMFDVRRSFFSNHLILNYIAKVSISIKLDVFFWPAAGLTPILCVTK